MRLRAPAPARRAPEESADQAACETADARDRFARRRYVATTPVVLAAVAALAVLPGIGARDAVRAATAPVVIDAAAAGPWLPDLRRVAAAWNAIGLGTPVRVAEPGAVRATVTVQLGRVAATCGRGTAGCVVTRGARKVLVLPRMRPTSSGAGTGPATLVAHEVGHLLGLGHRSGGCTVMRAEPSARGCDQLRFTRTLSSPQCAWRTLRAWRCRTVEQRLELCGPTAEDAASVARSAGGGGRAMRPRLCVAQQLSVGEEAELDFGRENLFPGSGPLRG